MPKINRIISKRHARRLRNTVVNKLLSRNEENLSISSDFTTNQQFSIDDCTVKLPISANDDPNAFHMYTVENKGLCDDEFVNNEFLPNSSPSPSGSLGEYYRNAYVDDSNVTETEDVNPSTENFDCSDIELCSWNTNTCNTNSDNDHDDEESYHYSLNPSNFRNELNNVLLKNNATQTLTTDLLKLLRPILPFLPADARTLLQTPRNTETIQLQNGEMRYFGIAACLERELNSCFLDENEVIKLDFNIDGLPLFKSSLTEFWPILGRVSSIKDHKPFAVAIFCGRGKPDPIDQYLQQFIDEIEFLLDNGIKFKTQSHTIKIRCFSCDAPARSWLKFVKAHSAIAGCERCRALATSRHRRLFYSNVHGYPLRKDQDFHDPKQNSDINQSKKCTSKQKRKQQKKHILGKSPLLRIRNLGLVSQFVRDLMHLVFLGVLKRLLLKYWVGGKRPFELSRNHLKIAEQIIRAIRSFIPSDFARKSRSFIQIERWKATEFRLFLLYTGPIIMKEVLDKTKYNHFILLHASVTILCRSNSLDENLELARSALIKFVEKSAEVYEGEFIVYNVHSLPHIVDDVKNYGPLDSHSCFPFENYLKTLKMRVRSKKQPLQQISNRISELNALKKTKIDDALQYKPLGITFPNGEGSEEVYFECSSVQYRGLKLSTKTPDNVVSINANMYLIEKIYCLHGEYKLFASPYKFKQNVYKKPLESSKLDIFYVRSLETLEMFAAVEFARHRNQRDVATVSILWLVDDNNYCYWPTSLGKATSYEDLVKNQPIFQKHWKKYAVTRVLRTSKNYQDIDDYVINLLQEGTTEDEGQIIEISKKRVPWEADPKGNASDEKNRDSGEMKKSTENESSKKRIDQYRKNDEPRNQSERNKTQDANDSSPGPEIIDNSDPESLSESNIDLDQQIIDKGQGRSDTETPRSAKHAPRNENGIDFNRKKTKKKQRSDTETPRSVRHLPRSENDSDSDQQRANKKLQSDTGTPRSTKYVSHSQNSIDLNQRRTKKSQHISAGIPSFSASKHDDNNSRPSTPVVNRHRLTETEFQEVILKYMEEGKVRDEQNQQLLCEISKTLKASIRGAEKPDKVPGLSITDYHVFEKFDTDLTDPIINKYIKNRLLAIGGVEVRAVSMGMLKCVMSDHLALLFNWQGQNQKKSFQRTNLQVLICDTIKQFFNKKLRATDKEIKSAIQDWLKQASNRIKSRSKKNTDIAGASSN